MRLTEALEQTATGALRRIASAHGLPHDDSTTRTELIDRLVERLSDPLFLRSELEVLGEPERAVLDLARANAAGEVRGLIADRDFPGAADALAERGLLFRVFAALGPLRGEVFATPAELLALLPEPLPDSGPPLDAAAPPSAQRRASDVAFSLFCLASCLGRPGASLEDDVRAWSDEPGDWPWQARWTFLQHLAQSAGLIVHQADGSLAIGPSLARLLDDPPALTQRLWRTFQRDRGFSELAEIGVEDAADMATPVAVRTALLDAWLTIPEDRWVALDGLSRWLRQTRPNVVREQLSTRGLVWAEPLDWSQLEAPLLRYLVLGPLYWLGLVGASADGARVIRRPRPEKRAADVAVWPDARVDPLVPSGAAQSTVLLVPTRAALGTALQAERYLELRQRGRPSRYELVQSHVAAALGNGGSVAECRHLLERLTAGALPAAVAEQLADWDRAFGALMVRPAVVLEARSAAELSAAVADDSVGRFVRARMSPTVVEVAAAEALELAAALRAAGHLPRVDAALRLSLDPRRAYAGLVDEQVLEFLLLSLLAFARARPAVLATLEGSATLLQRLERLFPPERLVKLSAAAAELAGELGSAPAPTRGRRPRRRRGHQSGVTRP